MVFVDHKTGLKIPSLERSVASPIDRNPILCATFTNSANKLTNTSHKICCPRMQHANSLFLIIHCDPVCFNGGSNRGFNMVGPWTLRTKPTTRRKYRLTRSSHIISRSDGITAALLALQSATPSGSCSLQRFILTIIGNI
jgi:hypothetical protein